MGITNNSFDFDNTVIGIVLEIDRAERRVAVYIPKMMPALSEYEAYSRVVNTSNGAQIVGTEFNSTVKIRNSFWVSSQRYDEPLPKVGSKVIVIFLDDNPRNAYWLPFNPNGAYERIEEEKYKQLFNFNFLNRNINISEEDSLTVNFPDNFSSAYIANGKDKILNILYRDNYIISNTEPVEPFSGLIWFNPLTEQLSIYKNDRFVSIVTDDVVSNLYTEVGKISEMMQSVLLRSSSGRVFFVSRLSFLSVYKPNDIVVLDAVRAGSGYYNYTKVSSTDWNPSEMENGIYYVQYINKLIEVINGIHYELPAYKYNEISENWESIDGWIASLIPTYNYGDITVPLETTTMDVININFADYSVGESSVPFDLRILEIRLDNLDMSKLAGFSYQFYSTRDSLDFNVGVEFSIIDNGELASPRYTFTPTLYASSSYLTVGTAPAPITLSIIVPDLPKVEGIYVDNLKCKVTRLEETTSTTIDFGDINITAKYRRG
jgi:hypothetical protein